MGLADVTRALVALLCASALWLVVSADEPAAAWLPLRVELTMDSSLALASPVAPARAFVVGRRGDLLRLRRETVVLQHAITDVAGASLQRRLDLRAADVDLPTGIDARVREVRPRQITVRLKPRCAESSARCP